MVILFVFSCFVTLILNIYKAEKVICRPSNQFVQIFAPPGSGKTTLAAKIVRDSFMQGKKVYSNVSVITANKFDLSDLGHKEFDDCTLIIDEAGTEVGNRNWHNNLDQDQIKFLKEHRHHNVDIYLFSQAYNDVDKKFRELTTLLLMLKKSRIPFVVKACAIRKKMDLINGQIVEFFEWDRGNSFKFLNIPHWAYFNSYQIDEILPEMYDRRYMKSDTI